MSIVTDDSVLASKWRVQFHRLLVQFDIDRQANSNVRGFVMGKSLYGTFVPHQKGSLLLASI
jgi:hypothetical protein